MNKIELPINTPVPVVLASLDGVTVPSQYGPAKSQTRFTAADGRAVYLPPYVAERVKALGSTRVTLCKSQAAHGGSIDWKVEPIIGEQKDGTFAIPKEKPDLAATSPEITAKPGLSLDQTPNDRFNRLANENTISKPESARKRFLWDHGRELIDAQAALMRYANENHGNAITAEDVRAHVITAYIQSRMMRVGGGR